jgi:hypothetical protein
MPFQEALSCEGELPDDVGLQGEHPGDSEDCVEGSIIKVSPIISHVCFADIAK